MFSWTVQAGSWVRKNDALGPAMVKDPGVSLCVISLGPIWHYQLSYVELKYSIFNQWLTVSHRRSERSGGAGQSTLFIFTSELHYKTLSLETFFCQCWSVADRLFSVLDWKNGAAVKDLGPNDQ